MHFFLKYGSNFLFYILRSKIFFTLHPTKSMKKIVCNFTLGHVLWRFTLITSWLHGKQIWLKIPWHWSVKRAWHPKLISVPDLRNCETTKKNKQKPVTLAEIYTLCKTYQMPNFCTHWIWCRWVFLWSGQYAKNKLYHICILISCALKVRSVDVRNVWSYWRCN